MKANGRAGSRQRPEGERGGVNPPVPEGERGGEPPGSTTGGFTPPARPFYRGVHPPLAMLPGG